MLICLSNDVQLNPGPASTQPPNISANGLRMPIKCITINARSLKSTHRDDTTGTTVCNLQRFQDLVYSENIDVVCVNETWLNSDFSDQEILHPGYTIYRRDRHNRSGGGVLIAIKTCSFKSVNNFEVVSDDVQHLEIVSAELKTDSNQTLLFVSCYRPPDADQSWMDEFKTFLNYTSDKYKNVIVSGDLNLPNIPWNSIGNTTGAQEVTFIELLNDHFLTQLITVPTRGKNTLDLVITSVPELVSVTEILPPDQTAVFTDHSATLYEVSAFVKAPPKFQRTVYDYDKGDFVGLRAALTAANLTSVIGNDEDTNNDWTRWKTTFLGTVSDYVPLKKVRGRNPLPWIDGSTLNMIKKKETVRQKLKRSPTSPSLREKFKSLRTEVKRRLRENREKFFSSLSSDLTSNPKRFWTVLKQRSKTSSIPDKISMATAANESADHNAPLTRINADSPLSIANLFNQYFTSVFTTYYPPYDSNTSRKPDNPPNVMTDITLTEREVLSVLESLDVTKATGTDGIPARILKETAAVIAPSLCSLFNKSLHTGMIPKEWKLANVVPVYKKGDKEHSENYRPISLLSIVSKTLERCVLNNIKDDLYSMVISNQHGFLTGKSCVTNLMEALDYIGSVLDRGGQVDTLYLDMSKAFDKVSHELLIQKLQEYGFGGRLLQWFNSYLTNRQQRVTVLGATSNTLPVTSGVPQGSILGPALFLLYVNDLPDAIKSSSVSMFADDTKIFKEIKSAADADLLQKDLSNLESWSTASGLLFNKNKCHAQSITRKTKPVITTYKMNESNLKSTRCERDLGVWVSSDLTWTKQILDQNARANKLLGYIRRNTRCIRSIAVRKSIYLALVRSNLSYATQIWCPQTVELISRLERTQRRATKYILKLPFQCSVSYSSRLQSLNLLPICYWHEFLDMVFFFKVVNGLVTVNQSILPRIYCPTRQTRSSSNSNIIKYVPPKCKSSTYQHSFTVRTIRIWNTLAQDLNLNMVNLRSFKALMFNYYFKSLQAIYDPENPRTFKTVCPKCNTSRSLTLPLTCCY